MLILRLITIVVWLAVAAYMAPAVWSLVRGQSRSGDPARLVCFAYAALAILGTLRFLIAPNHDDLFGAVYGLSISTALLTLATAKSYGRGPMV